jgi:hypothetical protein
MMLSTNPGDRRTAYEVAQLMTERLQVLGPVIENIISESLKPKLKRIFGIIKRRDMLPPMPDSMKDIVLDVEFISMLALAQKASATGGLERLAAIIGNLVPVFPEAKDSLNVDNFIATMSDLLDNPASILNGPEEIAALRKAQADALQQKAAQEEMAQGVATAGVAADAAKVMSDTQIGGGQSALSALFA